MVMLRILTEEQFKKFRKIEKVQTKLKNSKFHIDFNITCIKKVPQIILYRLIFGAENCCLNYSFTYFYNVHSKKRR